MTQDYSNSVSYASIALCRDAAAPLSEAEQDCLLAIARDQLREYLATGKELTDLAKRYPLTGRLKKTAPAFVTIKREGELRGCIGHVAPIVPLHESVRANTVSACQDPRFTTDPVTAAEEPKVHLEISVLSRHRMIGSPEEIEIGRDGLIIRRGTNQGLCRKAGLPASALKDRGTRIFRFSAQVFGERRAGQGE